MVRQSCWWHSMGTSFWYYHETHPHSKLPNPLALTIFLSLLSQCPLSLMSRSCFADVSIGPGSTAAFWLAVVFCNGSLSVAKRRVEDYTYLARPWRGGRCPYFFVNCGKIPTTQNEIISCSPTHTMQPLSQQGAALPSTLGYFAMSFSKSLKPSLSASLDELLKHGYSLKASICAPLSKYT